MFATAKQFFFGQKSRIKVSLLVSTLGKGDVSKSLLLGLSSSSGFRPQRFRVAENPHVCVLLLFVMVKPYSGDFYMLPWIISAPPPVVFGSPHSALFIVLSFVFTGMLSFALPISDFIDVFYLIFAPRVL